MKGEKEKLIQVTSIAIKNNPISVDAIIQIIQLSAILYKVGINIADQLKLLIQKLKGSVHEFN